MVGGISDVSFPRYSENIYLVLLHWQGQLQVFPLPHLLYFTEGIPLILKERQISHFTNLLTCAYAGALTASFCDQWIMMSLKCVLIQPHPGIHFSICETGELMEALNV